VNQQPMTPLVRPQERLLIELVSELPAGRLLCNTAGRAQFAAAYAQQHASSPVVCWFLDLYQCQQSELVQRPLPPNLRILCEADPPAEEFDVIAWAFSRQGDAELTREMLHTGHEHMAKGGRMVAAIDNPRDQWLHEQMHGLFAKVTRRPSDTGVIYFATKTQPLKKIKNYAAEFDFRDGERLIHLRTRPGVFSHRELDVGARALIKSMPICRGVILDLGCGSGAVGLAAVLRSDGRGHALDSNPRAIEATQWASERNELGNRLIPLLDCDGRSIMEGVYDLVLANPPYYSGFQLATLFVASAARALRPQGLLQVVTKMPAWYVEHLGGEFTEIETRAVGNYVVVAARKV
jgi:16S rRNA (guanine1207-N2)-methyltransferase